MNNAESYDADQQQQARELGHRLRGVADIASTFMVDHAVATAFIATGVERALRYLPPAEVAEWLQGIADEIVKPEAGTRGTA